MKTVKYSRNSSSMSANSFASLKLDPSAMIKHSQNLQNYISSKAILQLQEKSDLEVQQSNHLVGEILEREKTIVRDNVDLIIREYEINEQRRREVLNKRWNKTVFEPICERLEQSRTDDKMNKIIQKKRAIHQNYLDYLNRKDFASLSEYCADEYFPYALYAKNNSQQLNSNCKSKNTNRVQSANPTSIHEDTRFEEDRCQVRCLTGSILSRKDIETLRLPPVPLVPLGRQGTDCITWMYMPFSQINSDVRIRSRRKMRGDFNYGSVPFDFKNLKDVSDLRTPSNPTIVESN